ncbi:MAG: DegT/DnrJ/EryC1/StrS family aminotransferase [Cyanobacteria bacterium P01_C01_bin.89]
MVATLSTVPFVDLSLQHAPIKEDINRAIATVLDHGGYILGPEVKAFEENFAAACDVPHGIGVGSGTEAISLGLQAMGVGPGDEVILPANTFIATVVGVDKVGAKAVLVDCDPDTALMDLAAAEAATTDKTKVVLPVHLYGQLVSPKELLGLAERTGVEIFEDASQAHLATRDGYKAGTIGTATAFSFYPGKNLGAMGDGGIVVTSDETVAKKVRSLRNYGAPKKYFHEDRGTNSRLDTIQAAILDVKLPHLPLWNAQRNQAAQWYDEKLQSLDSQGIRPMKNHSGAGHIYHLYVVQVKESCPINREQLQERLEEKGVMTGIHYPIPCHLQPGYADMGWGPGSFPVAETLGNEILSLPMFPGLDEDKVDRVVVAINEAIAGK